ncbi:hypothetical protein BMS3Bbin01_00030 [bacterium BMS3Bbin01]|nr:hypothetical protein BMS3Bbin01_00030 [bacterium BMS3Bbin01]
MWFLGALVTDLWVVGFGESPTGIGGLVNFILATTNDNRQTAQNSTGVDRVGFATCDQHARRGKMDNDKQDSGLKHRS